MKLSERDRAFILAGLRCLQRAASRADLPEGVVSILNEGGIDGERFELSEVDALCEKVNGS